MIYKATIHANAPSKSNTYKIIRRKTPNGYKAGLAKSEKVRMFEIFARACYSKELKNANICKPFRLDLFVYFKTSASDLDNSAKAILDSLQNEGVIKNDNLCYELNMKKGVDRSNPRIELKLTIL